MTNGSGVLAPLPYSQIHGIPAEVGSNFGSKTDHERGGGWDAARGADGPRGSLVLRYRRYVDLAGERFREKAERLERRPLGRGASPHKENDGESDKYDCQDDQDPRKR